MAERTDTVRIAIAMLVMAAITPLFPFLAYGAPTGALELAPWVVFSFLCALLGVLALLSALRLRPLELRSKSLLLPGRAIGGTIPAQRDGRLRVRWSEVEVVTVGTTTLQVHLHGGTSVVVLRSRFRQQWPTLITAVEAGCTRNKCRFARTEPTSR